MSVVVICLISKLGISFFLASDALIYFFILNVLQHIKKHLSEINTSLLRRFNVQYVGDFASCIVNYEQWTKSLRIISVKPSNMGFTIPLLCHSLVYASLQLLKYILHNPKIVNRSCKVRGINESKIRL